jgi:hypothetical protein
MAPNRIYSAEESVMRMKRDLAEHVRDEVRMPINLLGFNSLPLGAGIFYCRRVLVPVGMGGRVVIPRVPRGKETFRL